jgi:hypothetical protein
MCFVPIPKFGCPWFGLGKCYGAKKTDTSSLVVPIFSSSLPFFSSLSSTLAPCLVDSVATVERRYHRCSGSVDDETGSTVGAVATPVVRAAMLVGASVTRTVRADRPLALWAVEAAAAPVTTAVQAGPFATPSSPLMAMAWCSLPRSSRSAICSLPRSSWQRPTNVWCSPGGCSQGNR